METDIKQLLTEQEGRIKGHIDVLVEDFNAKVELISEQHTSMMNKIESLDTKVESLNMQMIETNIRLGHIEDQLRRKVDYEEFEKLEKRVALLEAR